MVTTSAGPPPDSSAENDLGRISAMWGPLPVKRVRTSLVPPNTGSVTTTESPSAAMSTLLVRTGWSSATDRRAATSRPS